jgi:hypothetical protein
MASSWPTLEYLYPEMASDPPFPKKSTAHAQSVDELLFPNEERGTFSTVVGAHW